MQLASQVIGIVQARTGSTRLPGKVLKRTASGMSMLRFLLMRLQKSKTCSAWVVATSTSPADAVLREHLPAGMSFATGPERDVLQRFIDALEGIDDAATVVRVCADNPLIDPLAIDRLVEAHLAQPAIDYVSYVFEDGTPVILRGIGLFAEVARAGALRRAARETRDIAYREHVTKWIYAHADRYKCAWLPLPKEWDRPEVRLTVDTPEDFERLLSLEARVGSERLAEMGATELLLAVTGSAPPQGTGTDGRLPPGRTEDRAVDSSTTCEAAD